MGMVMFMGIAMHIGIFIDIFIGKVMLVGVVMFLVIFMDVVDGMVMSLFMFPFSARAIPELITKSVESITSVTDPFILLPSLLFCIGLTLSNINLLKDKMDYGRINED